MATTTYGVPSFSVDLRDHGTVYGDDSHDDLPAFKSCLAYLKTFGGNGPVPKLLIPLPKTAYFLSGPVNVHFAVHILGVGGGQSNVGTLLRFAENQWGIVFHEYRTTDGGGGGTSPSGLGDAQGSILEGVAIWGGGAQSIKGPYTNSAATNRSATGVWVRTGFVTLRDVSSLFFSGSGITVEATAGSTGSTAGNASLFRLENCSAQYNAFDGFAIFGSDANSGKIDKCSAISNGASGFREYSFLGNTYDACHARDNCQYDPIISGSLGGTCQYNGGTYYLVGAMNGAAQEAAASTTVPGTNDSVWRSFPIANGGSLPQWESGLTWRVSAPYVTNPGNTNAKNVFIGCYTELGQPRIQATYPTLFVGGALDVGMDKDSTATTIQGGQHLSTNNGITSVSNDGNRGVLFGVHDADISEPGLTVLSGFDNAAPGASGAVNWQLIYDGVSKLLLSISAFSDLRIHRPHQRFESLQPYDRESDIGESWEPYEQRHQDGKYRSVGRSQRQWRCHSEGW